VDRHDATQIQQAAAEFRLSPSLFVAWSNQRAAG
jgi:hypothetical protein